MLPNFAMFGIGWGVRGLGAPKALLRIIPNYPSLGLLGVISGFQPLGSTFPKLDFATDLLSSLVSYGGGHFCHACFLHHKVVLTLGGLGKCATVLFEP